MDFEEIFDWCLSWYDKRTEVVVGSERFTGLSLEEAKEIFGETEEFITDTYEVSEVHRKRIQPFVKHDIVLSEYHYSFKPILKEK